MLATLLGITHAQLLVLLQALIEMPAKIDQINEHLVEIKSLLLSVEGNTAQTARVKLLCDCNDL